MGKQGEEHKEHEVNNPPKSHSQVDTGIRKVREAFSKWLKLKDPHIIDVALGVVVANSFEGDSLFIYLVGPPSSGKTEIIRSLNGHPEVYFMSSLTAQTFISGWKDRKGGAKNSLLLKLKDRGITTIAMKDFTTVLTMRNEARQEILSQIREIADGNYKKVLGTGAEIEWEGKLGFITGVTGIIDEYHAVHQLLGERFLYFRITPAKPEEMARTAQKFAGKEHQMRSELRETVKQFLKQFENPNIEDLRINSHTNKKLISLAQFVAEGRTAVSRSRYSQAIQYPPDPEGPSRIMKQLFKLGCGIAIIHGKDAIGKEIYSILMKVGRDCLPSYRKLVIGKMWNMGIKEDQWKETKELADLFQQPLATARLHLEDLMVLGIVDREERKNHQIWRLSEKYCDLIKKIAN